MACGIGAEILDFDYKYGGDWYYVAVEKKLLYELH